MSESASARSVKRPLWRRPAVWCAVAVGVACVGMMFAPIGMTALSDRDADAFRDAVFVEGGSWQHNPSPGGLGLSFFPPSRHGVNATGEIALDVLDDFPALVQEASKGVGGRALCVVLRGQDAEAFRSQELDDTGTDFPLAVCNVFKHGRAVGWAHAEPDSGELRVHVFYAKRADPFTWPGIEKSDL